MPLLPWLAGMVQVHCDEPAGGDILVFLTGQEEIESCERLIRERAAALPPDPDRPALLALPIYAALPPEQQLRVFQPAPEGTRKVGALGGQGPGGAGLARWWGGGRCVRASRARSGSRAGCAASFEVPGLTPPPFIPLTPTRPLPLQVVLATNIAETSITIPGVRYVIDSGMVKARSYRRAREGEEGEL